MAVIRTDYLRKLFTACGFDACAWQQAYYRHQAEFVRRKPRVIQAFAQDQTVARVALRQALRPVTVRQYLKKYVNEGLAGLCAPQQRPSNKPPHGRATSRLPTRVAYEFFGRLRAAGAYLDRPHDAAILARYLECDVLTRDL